MPVSTRFASVNFASLASRKICFRKSHIFLAVNVVPLGSLFWWLSSTAGYVPSNEAQISLSDMAHHQRVLSSGCYPFLSGRSGIPTNRNSLADLSVSTKGVIATANRSAFALSQSLATPFAVLSSVSMAVTFVTVWLYRKQKFRSRFCVFYFSKIDLFDLTSAETPAF